MNQRISYLLLILMLTAFVVVAFCVSILVGPAATGVSDALTATARADSDVTSLIIREIRLPRALLGLMIGAALGLAGASLQLTLDPGQASIKELGRHQTDDGGQFRVPVNEVGAGVLIYEIDVFCQRRGYRSVQKRMPLPGSGKRLLIIMSQGVERSRRPRDVIEESLEAGRRQGAFD